MSRYSRVAPVSLVHANIDSDKNWVPAGPAMNVLQTIIYPDQISEFNSLQAASPSIDLTDSPLSSALIASLTPQTSFLVTQPRLSGFSEIEFNLANNFWGCQFNQGSNSPPCGANIRQGIAHLVDKVLFANNEAGVAGHAVAIDNPVPAGGGIPTPNPCNWDPFFPQSSTSCIVGTGAPGTAQYTGGTAYHLASATGVNNKLWQPALGSLDFCAAAQHFINASLATGRDPTTCVLTGIAAGVTTHTVNFFIRNDNVPLNDLGDSYAQEICALFTGLFNAGCSPYLITPHGSITAFPGFITSPNNVNLSWGMYTAGGQDSYATDNPFDGAKDRLEDSLALLGGSTDVGEGLLTLYAGFLSQFVDAATSIQPPYGPCSPLATGSYSPSNYVYMCNSDYDGVSSQMEAAQCISSPIGGAPDPTPGQTVPTFANCSGQPVTGTCTSTSGCTGVSAGYQTEDTFGRGEYAIPVFTQSAQYAYLNNGWTRAINSVGGLANYFTWLNIWNRNPANPGTVRQGFSETTLSLNPYLASVPADIAIIYSVYDALMVGSPYYNSQLLDWMTVSHQQLNNGQLTYTPPSGTVSTFRLTLRSDLFFHGDSSGHPAKTVTSFDVAFSYLSLKEKGAFLGAGLGPMTGITILSPTQFDININVNAAGPFILPPLVSVPILPGFYWSSVGRSAWDTDVNSCEASGNGCFPVQYFLSSPSGPVACGTGTGLKSCQPFITSTVSAMEPSNNQVAVGYDPLASGILIGSGPWECKSSTGVVGTGCSNTLTQNPTGSFTLQRFGVGTVPGAGLTDHYFRSNGNLALWIWSQDNGDFTHDFLNFSVVAACFGIATGGCSHFAHGIGGTGGAGITVVQISIVNRFLGVNWVAGNGNFVWTTSPPAGIVALPPVLYEGSVTLNPCSIDPVGGYDC